MKNDKSKGLVILLGLTCIVTLQLSFFELLFLALFYPQIMI
jgi:hypothetical protein